VAKIQYIGKKKQKEDNVAGTGTVWNGPGDVQEVNAPLEVIEKIIAHKGVWLLVPDDTKVAAPCTVKPTQAPKGKFEDEEVEAPPVVDFNRMGKDKIDDYCRVHLKVKIDQRHDLPKIRAKAWEAYAKHMTGVMTAGLRK